MWSWDGKPGWDPIGLSILCTVLSGYRESGVASHVAPFPRNLVDNHHSAAATDREAHESRFYNPAGQRAASARLPVHEGALVLIAAVAN